jgi:queuine tRNA-ribosyltransferase
LNCSPPTAQARRGRLTLAHGVVETPVFMPVGTYGTVKAMTRRTADIGAQIVLGNTFHLWLRPGAGGHRGARRPAPLHGLGQAHPHRLGRLPGVQLGALRKITEEGVKFSSRRSTATSSS